MKLEAKNITFAYPGEAALLDDFSFELASGDFVGLIGPNGSGKSTIQKILTGRILPQKGEVCCDGKPLRRMDHLTRAEHIGAVAQNLPPPLDYTVRTMVMTGRASKISQLAGAAKEDLCAVAKAMAEMDIAHLAHRRYCELSGGEKQRVFIAMALAQETDFLLLDEPTNALDIAHSNELARKLGELAHERNLGVLLISHDLQLAARCCNRIILIKNGKIIDSGAPEEVITPANLEHAFHCQAEICRDSRGRILISPY